MCESFAALDVDTFVLMLHGATPERAWGEVPLAR